MIIPMQLLSSPIDITLHCIFMSRKHARYEDWWKWLLSDDVFWP